MRAVLIPLVLLACWIPVAAAQQPHAVEAVVIEGPVYETPSVTPLEVAQSLDAVRQEIAAAKETYGEESTQVRLLTEILHNLEGTFRQQLTDRGMIRTAGHQVSAEHEKHEADDEEDEDDDEEEDDEAEAEDEDEDEEHAGRSGQHRGHNDAAIARLTKQVRELRHEVELLKRRGHVVPRLHHTLTPVPQAAPPVPVNPPRNNWPAGPLSAPLVPTEQQAATPWSQDPEWNNPNPNNSTPPQFNNSAQENLTLARKNLEQQMRISQLERDNALLRHIIDGMRRGSPAGPRAERVLNALRDQTMQHQAEATKRIEQSFAQMQRRLQELEQRQPMQRPREERRIEERRREDRRPRTSSAQPL